MDYAEYMIQEGGFDRIDVVTGCYRGSLAIQPCPIPIILKGVSDVNFY
jgi:hypothetical protein